MYGIRPDEYFSEITGSSDSAQLQPMNIEMVHPADLEIPEENELTNYPRNVRHRDEPIVTQPRRSIPVHQCSPAKSPPGLSPPGLSQPGPSHPGPSQAGPSQAGPSQPGPSQPGPSQHGRSQPDPSQTGRSRSKKNRPTEIQPKVHKPTKKHN